MPTPEGTGSAPRDALRILILEDNPADAELEQRLLVSAGLDFTAVVVDTEASYAEQLAVFRPDVIVADFSLPGFSGEGAIKIAQKLCPDVPVIVLSGVIGDEAAAELIRKGAADYILKDRPARLASVIRRAVAEAEQRSQLARLEAHLQRAQRMQSIGRLAGGVAHEFNSQVCAMLSSVDLNQVVSGIGELLRSTAGASTKFHLSLSPQLWPVTADPGQVVQILLNLTVNAREAMPDGGSFWIETQNVTIDQRQAADLGLASGAYVCLTARDSGLGMEPEAVEHAFEPFFTTKPFVEGGGLGLASVYGIMRQAGGTVGISSAPGAGTTVTAWLPAAGEPPA